MSKFSSLPRNPILISILESVKSTINAQNVLPLNLGMKQQQLEIAVLGNQLFMRLIGMKTLKIKFVLKKLPTVIAVLLNVRTVL